jgi:pyruvate ferredoxin oxidoreductase gamma subunit
VLWHERLAFPGTVLTLGRDGANVGRHTAAMACAGAAARLTGAIPRAELEAAVRQELAALPPDDLPDNVDAALAGYDAMHANASIVTQGQPPTADALPRPNWIDLPADPARIAAPDIREPATSLRANTGLWRESRPVIDFDRCNRCSWICSTLCPDSAIAVDEARVPSIDYAHCKGCMVCVAVCPANAISIQREADALAGAGS